MINKLTFINHNHNIFVKFIMSSADNYKQYDHRTHVYMKPDTYIGADEPMTREEWIFDLENSTMMTSNVNFVPGCERLYFEDLQRIRNKKSIQRKYSYDAKRNTSICRPVRGLLLLEKIISEG